MANRGWTSRQIRDSLANKIKDLIKKKVDPSITNSTQFLDLAVRELIGKLEVQQINHKTEVKA